MELVAASALDVGAVALRVAFLQSMLPPVLVLPARQRTPGRRRTPVLGRMSFRPLRHPIQKFYIENH